MIFPVSGYHCNVYVRHNWYRAEDQLYKEHIIVRRLCGICIYFIEFTFSLYIKSLLVGSGAYSCPGEYECNITFHIMDIMTYSLCRSTICLWNICTYRWVPSHRKSGRLLLMFSVYATMVLLHTYRNHDKIIQRSLPLSRLQNTRLWNIKQKTQMLDGVTDFTIFYAGNRSNTKTTSSSR